MKGILKNKKVRVFIFIYIIILSSYFSIYTFSKYIGRVNGDGQIGVAKWNVSLAGDSDSISVMSGGNGVVYNLDVTSNSQVGIDYYVSMSGVPDGVSVSLDEGGELIATDGVINFGKVGTIYANAEEKTVNHKLTIKASLEANGVTNKNVNIDVKFIQIN